LRFLRRLEMKSLEVDSLAIRDVLGRVTVSKGFWNFVNEVLPSLNEARGYRELFWYLLFGAWHDNDTKRLLLPSKLLCSFEGRSVQNSRADSFLRRFRAAVLPRGGDFRWSRWREGKCRQLTNLHFGWLQPFVDAEYERRWHKLGRVYLNGRTFSSATIRQARREEFEAIQSRQAYCFEAEFIRNYLNNLPPHLFTKCVGRYYSAAHLAALRLQNPAVMVEQLRLLRCIQSQPQPFYEPSSEGNTIRLFTGCGIPNLQRDVRKALTADWVDVDLRCSQLAICAALWNVERINTFLRSGENFWTHVLNAIGVPPSEWTLAKREIKQGLYSICYGMELNHVKGTTALRLTKAGLDKHIATRFVNHPLLQALLVAREAALKSIATAGGAMTCFGKWCSISASRQPRHIMAEVAQALELKLIYPAFRLASETPELTITLFQHDGFSVHFRRRPKTWLARIAGAVHEEIERQGIITRLEW
jgi:hypothetical protein